MSGDDKIGTAFAQLFRPGVKMLPPKPATADDPDCPKCGWSGIADLGWKVYVYASAEDAAQINIANGECLLVRCGRCGFKWGEPVRKPG